MYLSSANIHTAVPTDDTVTLTEKVPFVAAFDWLHRN
jgi:hypothetical protein